MGKRGPQLGSKPAYTEADYPEWGGPFVQRADYPTLRYAMWMNCAYCGSLFKRSVDEVTSKRKHGAGSQMFCSIGCGKRAQRQLRPNQCVICGTVTYVRSEDRKRRTCSDECRSEMMRRIGIGHKHEMLNLYADTWDIEPKYEALACEFCGSPQRIVGRSRHYYVRLAMIEGTLMARCKKCYHNQTGK